MLENFRVAEDMPIESDLVSQALDKVQTQVEEYFQANRQQVFHLCSYNVDSSIHSLLGM
jgi:preprotein translocase subunit SecA